MYGKRAENELPCRRTSDEVHSDTPPYKRRKTEEKDNDTEGSARNESANDDVRLQRNGTISSETAPFVSPLLPDASLKDHLDIVQVYISHPKIWNSNATQLMMNLNKRYTNEGLYMEMEPVCDHPVLQRILHLLNYVACKTICAVVKNMVEAGCKKEEVEIVLDEFVTQAFFMLALLGRNGTHVTVSFRVVFFSFPFRISLFSSPKPSFNTNLPSVPFRSIFRF